MKMLSKWIGNIISLLLFALLALLLIYAISSKMNGGKPNIMGYEILTVLSGSMEPGIKTGSLIAVKPIDDTNSLKVGDVITFKAAEKPDMLITHRIKEIKVLDGQTAYITKGDNNDSPDSEPVLSNRVVAKYQGITIPYLGYLFSYSKTKLGIILMMIVPGAILVLSQLINVWKLILRMEKKDESVMVEQTENLLVSEDPSPNHEASIEKASDPPLKENPSYPV